MPATDPAALKPPVIVTCSMARDLDLFALLAGSIDRLADPSIRHDVVVPRADLAAFARFAAPHRRILPQEQVLPLRLWKTPAALARLSRFSAALRRPIYITPRLKTLRGWMLQQLLKIEMARASDSVEVVHVDSDVFFSRRFGPAELLDQGRPRLFRAEGRLTSADHRKWIAAAETILGLSGVPDDRHYVENCVPWSPAVVRALCAHIEATHGRRWFEVVLEQPSVSEYYLYGIFADRVMADPGLAVSDHSLCCTLWSAAGGEAELQAQIAAMLKPWHVAIGLQSTYPLPAEVRARLASGTA